MAHDHWFSAGLNSEEISFGLMREAASPYGMCYLDGTFDDKFAVYH
jgi:hypothetical protein